MDEAFSSIFVYGYRGFIRILSILDSHPKPMQQKSTLKIGAYLSLAIFGLLLYGAIYFYAERMFFADSSPIAFQAINEEKLQIQQYRFGAFITQMVPILGAKIGLSVKNILIAYSASFNVFYLFVAALMLFVFRNYRLVILYAFYWTLVTTYTFFWPNNEVHQGIAYMFLLFSLLKWLGEKKVNFVISVLSLLLLGSTAIFCHPLVLPPLFFLWVYLIAEKDHWYYNRQQTIILSLVLIVVAVTKMYVSQVYAGYDKELLGGVGGLSLSAVSGVFSSQLAKDIFHFAYVNYWILPVLGAAGIITLLVKRHFFLAVWTFGCALLFFILLCLTFKGYSEFYTESEIMPGIVILTAPFVFVTLKLMRSGFVAILLLLIFGLRIQHFIETNGHFSFRVQHLANMVAKMKDKNLTKVVLVKSDTNVEWRWMVEWGFASETIMISAANWDKPVRQFVIMAPGELEKRLPKNNSDVIACFSTWPIEKVNMTHFQFDTTQPYAVLSYEEFIK
ncbi:MAG TPA: hypothetical protein VEB40_06805 [Flavipsychrobacter sp.]|nr:hypothetical protein [Flavipsychrobacter sp.]